LVTADSAKQATLRYIEIEHPTATLDAINSRPDLVNQLCDGSDPLFGLLPHGLANQFVRNPVRKRPPLRAVRFA
jgi:hypothetical protein